MNTYKGLQINQIIEVEVKTGDYRGSYPSRLEEIDEDNLTVAAPIKRGYVVPLEPGTTLEIRYVNKEACYNFVTVILQAKVLPLPLLIIKKPVEVLKTQRRNFVRFSARLPLKITLLSSEMEEFSEGLITQTKDISGGGIQFSTQEPVSRGDVLQMGISIPGSGDITAIGNIVRVQEATAGKNKYLCSVSFKIIEEADRNKIIRYIFEEQRKLRAKGLL